MARRKSTTAAAPVPAAVNEAPVEQPAEKPQTVTLRGRLCADPVLRHTNSGKAVTNLRLAILDTEPTEFITAVCFGRTAETSSEFLRKARVVDVTGWRRSREWVAQDGSTRQTDELVARSVHFLNRNDLQSVTAEKAVA